jgi:hypothetical protein
VRPARAGGDGAALMATTPLFQPGTDEALVGKAVLGRYPE